MIQLQRSKGGIALLVVIGLIVVSFGIGALRLNDQAHQINQLLEDQSPLIFAFENTGTSGRIMTFEVTCEREENGGKYKCVTKQTQPVVAELTPVPTPRAP